MSEGDEEPRLEREVLGAPEPWAPWETRLCVISLTLGVLGLLVLGAAVNLWLL